MNEDKERDGEVGCTMRDCGNSSLWKSVMLLVTFGEKADLEVFCDKDGVSGDKSNLRYRNGEEDRVSHPRSVQCAANV